MKKQTRGIVYTCLALLFGFTGLLILRVGCLYVFVVHPCDPTSGIIGFAFWFAALAMIILGRKIGWSQDTTDAPEPDKSQSFDGYALKALTSIGIRIYFLSCSSWLSGLAASCQQAINGPDGILNQKKLPIPGISVLGSTISPPAALTFFS